jgi:hypothetical protein
MPESWTRALSQYSYPVDLGCYHRANAFPGFFETLIPGDRESTIAFENHFRDKAPENIAAFFEVVFWKLYSQPQIRQGTTDRIVDYILQNNIQSIDLWNAVIQFIENQSIVNLRVIRNMLGLRTNVLAIPLTFPALASPQKIPMIDNQVARWVNDNIIHHNTDRNNILTQFYLNYTSLRENDFDNYLNWITWCQETSKILTRCTKRSWRARDVEMAVFTAQRENIPLNPLRLELNFEL